MSTAANWLSSTLPSTGAELAFGPLSGAENAPYSDAGAWSSTTAAAGLRFLGASDTTQGSVNSSAYTLSGNSLTLTGPINNDSTNNQVIDLNLALTSGTNCGLINTLSNNITFNGVISGNGDIAVTKTGAGTAVLAGTNTYTSANTVISAGPWRPTPASACPRRPTSPSMAACCKTTAR